MQKNLRPEDWKCWEKLRNAQVRSPVYPARHDRHQSEFVESEVRMLDQDLVRVVESQVKHDLEDRRVVFKRQIAEIKEKMAGSHALYSSGTIREILDAMGDEYRVRVHLIWQAFARAIDAKRIKLADSVVADVKARLVTMLDGGSEDLRKCHAGLNNLVRGSSPPKSIESLRDGAMDRVSTEIDHASLRHSSSPESGSPVVNIYQSYGIIQTGPESVASWNSPLSPEEHHELLKAIAAIRDSIIARGLLNPSQESQATELTSDIESEAKREQPNRHRIRGALQGLAMMIQTAGAAPDAYRLLKGVAALFGLQLPG